MCNSRLKEWKIHKHNTEERPGHGAQYQGDFFGDRSWINQHSDKRCTSQRLCRRDEVASAAVFLVEKTHESMCITSNSTPLLYLVQSTLRELGVNLGISSSVDGLLLLRHHGALQGRLSEWRANGQRPGHSTLLRELELLVDGVLCNGEVFKNFGYEQLKERGIIDDAVLETLSRQNLDASVNGLDEAFESCHNHIDVAAKNILWFPHVYLRNRLAVHHRHMKQKASLPTSAFREVGHELSGYRSLWSLGVETLKLLTSGRAPRSLAEAVAFLCIARAMVDAPEARHHRDSLQEFIIDLPRWQVIFEQTDLAAYREAVWLIWDIDVDSYDAFQTIEGHPFPAEHLPYGNPGGFEKLSWILASSIDDCFGTLPGESLWGSQRLRMQQEESLGFRGHPPETTDRQPLPNITTERQPQRDPPPLDPWGIFQDQPPISEDEGARNRRVVECLVTAVAFALVILLAGRRSQGVVRVMGIFGNKESFV
ncbi:hypothetical protein LY76DRAFT_605422 [Colletotrichum caudatum]|nr:hypothetical protein LY76DRAFT_605422 [Colletotrichum caudatum]